MIVAFDIGGSGGAACFFDDGRLFDLWKLEALPLKYDSPPPLNKKPQKRRNRNMVRIDQIVGILERVKRQRRSVVMGSRIPEQIRVVIETPQPRGGQGSAVQTLGNYFAVYHAVVMCGLEDHFTPIHSGSWMADLFAENRIGNKLNPNKANTIGLASILLGGFDKLPTEKPKGRKKHDGIADAVCLCLWWVLCGVQRVAKEGQGNE